MSVWHIKVITHILIFHWECKICVIEMVAFDQYLGYYQRAALVFNTQSGFLFVHVIYSWAAVKASSRINTIIINNNKHFNLRMNYSYTIFIQIDAHALIDAHPFIIKLLAHKNGWNWWYIFIQNAWIMVNLGQNLGPIILYQPQVLLTPSGRLFEWLRYVYDMFHCIVFYSNFRPLTLVIHCYLIQQTWKHNICTIMVRMHWTCKHSKSLQLKDHPIC